MVIKTIGDVHGHKEWKNAVYLFDEQNNIKECLIGKGVDKVIFLGDYVDDWELKNEVIYNNLIEIINLKKKYPDNVILLWGNHDVAYLRDEWVSGHRPEMKADLVEIFRKNLKLFQLAYQQDNIIWTHAGIHKGWWKYYAEPALEGKKETRFAPFVVLCENIADKLNLMMEFNYENIFMVGLCRGGIDKVGGPLWADKREIYDNPLPNFEQIVGHNPVKKPMKYEKNNRTSITFCDCLTRCDYFYTLNL